ncbi:4509_t:CDS:2, partial [Paraglomus occultum]
RSAQDEKLIEAIFQTNLPSIDGQTVYGSTQRNLIVDARPTANAMANRAMGAGTEHMENYKNCQKQHMGIDNIHVMRESLAKMVDGRLVNVRIFVGDSKIEVRPLGVFFLLIQSSDIQRTPIKRSHLDKSHWLKHISSLLESAVIIINHIHVFNSHVLVHCSDGWDRTAQLTSIAELCLDPYYRTLRGFQVLVEKDWISFGHKFSDRSGHLSNEKYFITISSNNAKNAVMSMNNLYNQSHVRETSPVFHQFLDCVYQLLCQYPDRFEFNEKFLIEMHYHVYSCQYGTFLFNSEKERVQYNVMASTNSLWDYINSKAEEFTNELYDGGAKDKEKLGDGGVLFPKTKPSDLKYWAGLFGKKDEELNGNNDDTLDDRLDNKSRWRSESPIPRSSSSPNVMGEVFGAHEDNGLGGSLHTKSSSLLPYQLYDPWRDSGDSKGIESERKIRHKSSGSDLNAKELVQNFARVTLNWGSAAYSNLTAKVSGDTGAVETTAENKRRSIATNGQPNESTGSNVPEIGSMRELTAFTATNTPDAGDSPSRSSSSSHSPPLSPLSPTSAAPSSPSSSSNPFSFQSLSTPSTPTLRPWQAISNAFSTLSSSTPLFQSNSALSRDNHSSYPPEGRSGNGASTTPPSSPRLRSAINESRVRSNSTSPLATPPITGFGGIWGDDEEKGEKGGGIDRGRDGDVGGNGGSTGGTRRKVSITEPVPTTSAENLPHPLT